MATKTQQRHSANVEVFWQRGTQHFQRNVLMHGVTDKAGNPVSMIDENENLVPWREPLPPVEDRVHLIGINSYHEAIEKMDQLASARAKQEESAGSTASQKRQGTRQKNTDNTVEI